MKQFKLNVTSDNGFWKVASSFSWDGPYDTSTEAFDAAVRAAHLLRAAGHTTHVSLHDSAGAIELTVRP